MEYFNGMSNADVIRKMDNNELHNFLEAMELGNIDYQVTFCDLCKESGNELNLDCSGCLGYWLRNDAKKHYQGLLYPKGLNSGYVEEVN